MVGQYFPYSRVIKYGSEIFHVPDVNTIQPQNGKTCGKCPGHTSDAIVKDFLKPRYPHQRLLRAQAPVVEIASNNQRVTKRYLLIHKATQPFDLFAAVRFTKSKMN